MNKFTVFILLLSYITISGCKWQDDFRSRQQPQYGYIENRPTLNEDSRQYVGDKVAHELQGKPLHSETIMTEIDERSYIPELPDYPSGINE